MKYIEYQFALQEVLQMSTNEFPLSWWLCNDAISALSKEGKSLGDYDLEDPHFIARDSFIIVQFFEKTKTEV